MTAATRTEHGNRDVAIGGEILRTVVGSGVHGIAIEGTDDHDEMGASHALRLAYQGLEIARDARLTLPMPEHERERVLRVQRGDVPAIEDVLHEIGDVRSKVEHLLAANATPSPTCKRSPTGPPAHTAGTGVGPEGSAPAG